MPQPIRHPPRLAPDEVGGAVDAGLSDAEMVAGARAGDRAAWAELYHRYAPVVHGVLLARLGHGEADDLTQEVFVRAMRRLGDVRDGASVGGWLIAIARNAAVSYIRRPRPGALADHEPAGSTRTDTEQSEEAQRVLAVIRTLPEAYRETLILRLVEGLTGPALAARMGMTHGSVRVNLHRGMQMLRERLGLSPRDGDSGDRS